jgi:hypothetical protein
MVERPLASGRDRGGDRIQTSRALRLRLALIAAALSAATAVALAPLATAGSMSEDELLVAAVALSALVFPLLGVDRLIPWVVAMLGGCVLLASEHGDIGNVAIALSAALLLLVAECTSAACDLRGVVSIERRLALRLIARLAAEAGAAAGLAAVVLASASLGVRADLATFTLGLVAAVSLLALLAALVTRR